MKTVSKVALAAMLGLGAGGLTLAVPAVAKDKKNKAPEAGKPTYSPEFVKAAQPLQAALKTAADPTALNAAKTDQDKTAAQAALTQRLVALDPQVTAAELAAKTDDDKYMVGLMRIQIEQARVRVAGADQQRLRPTLEGLVANPKTPADQRGQFALVLGKLALQRGDKAAGLTYLTQAQRAGNTDPDLPILVSQLKLQNGDLAGGSADLAAAIKANEDKGVAVPAAWYGAAADAAAKRKDPQALTYLTRWVAANPTTKAYHDALTIYGLQRGSVVTLDKGSAVDVFRLMRQTRSLDQYGYGEYAQKVIDGGLPDEGKAVLSEGFGNTKLPRTPTYAALLDQAKRQAELQGSLAPLETKANASANGKLAEQTADAYLGQANYAKAVALYRTALGKGGVDANAVNTHLGIALALSGDKEGARTAFKTVSGEPRAGVAQFWLTWLDHPATA